MATTYRYRTLNDDDSKSASFRELVELVRDEKLLTDDLVIADWQQEWGPAAEVIGLFHTAGRDDVLRIWEQEQAEKKRRFESKSQYEFASDEIDSMLAANDSMRSNAESLARMEQVEADYLEDLRQQRNRSDLEHPAQPEMNHLIQSAERKQEEREQRRQQKSIISFLTIGTIQSMFRMAMSVAVANLTTYLVFKWSEKEMQRFPNLQPGSENARIFPIYGPCSQTEFFFLLVDTMIISAIIGYGLARLLEYFVDE